MVCDMVELVIYELDGLVKLCSTFGLVVLLGSAIEV